MTLALANFFARPSRWNGLLLAAMTITSGLRIALAVTHSLSKKRRRRLGLETVQWEALYAINAISMMAVIGLLSAAMALEGETGLGLVASIILVMGVIGGIAGRDGSRPKLVHFEMVATLLPFLMALLIIHSTATLVLALLVGFYYFAIMASTTATFTSLRTALVNEAHNKDLSQRIRKSAEVFDVALNNMTSGLLLFDLDHRLVMANDKVKTLMGRELIDRSIGVPAAEISQDLFKACETLMKRGKGSLIFVDGAHGRSFELRLKSMPEQGAVVNVDDITEKLKKEEEVRHLAHHDALTGLPNRYSLTKFIDGCLEKETADLVLVYVGLDHFKDINDQFGHAAGDSVLVEVSERLKRRTHHFDFVARLGGDEFVIVFQEVANPLAMTAVAQEIIECISRPYRVNERIVTIGASAGLCSSRGIRGKALELLRLADVALYEAKLRNRGAAIWFNPTMDDRAYARREMTAALRQAIDDNSLQLYYQPVIDFRSGRVVACEALSRWTHPVFGIVPPGIFIPLAEESDLIHKLGAWSLTRACLDAKSWEGDVKVAVNLSVTQFKQGSISARIFEILRQTGLDPSRLEIEITESVLADDLIRVKRELKAMVDGGISIALDDFGTGYSSLSLLHKLPIDKVKLDGSFVMELDEDPSAVSLIASIVQMAQTMRKQLVIEGVETHTQLALITGVHARLIQGFYFCRPLPAQDIAAYLSRNLEDIGQGLRAIGQAAMHQDS